jgi:hypothetical protein
MRKIINASKAFTCSKPGGYMEAHGTQTLAYRKYV